MHGRTAKQRYARTADWSEIENVKSAAAEANPVLKVIGNGDIFSYSDAAEAFKTTDSVMIGRGALVKPWIFTEIKQKTELDYSSEQRLALLRRFAAFCLEHNGTDAFGLEKAREQFLLNWCWMSRYVPLGIRVPGSAIALGQRVPAFTGRDDLETLMGGQQVADWVAVSELLFGPVPEGF